MNQSWVVIAVTLVYFAGLFAVAHFGDTVGRRFVARRGRGAIYALSLGVYCTSWTFFGSVGLASSRGLEFVTIYIGPILVFALGYPLILRVVRLAKAQNITSIADFVAARYGKAAPVAALVASIAVIGSVPYISLQLKAIAASLTTALNSIEHGETISGSALSDLSFIVAVVLAGFAMAFGTRRLDATEHQDGLMLAIAMESVIKLMSFLGVGIFVTWGMFDGLDDLTQRVSTDPHIKAIISTPPDIPTWIVTTLLSSCAILLLPRQFHVAVVENRNEADVRKAAWIFPLYLIAINLFVVPLAIAGLLTFPSGTIERDMTVLALPIEARSAFFILSTLIGGLSAATAMVVVASVALSIMVSNDLIMPLFVRGRSAEGSIPEGDISALILGIRRLAIIIVIGLAYLYLSLASDADLAAIGLLSFACIAQIGPALIGGLVWRRATARGAVAGLTAGCAVWAYTLLVPSLDPASVSLGHLVAQGPLGISALRPTALFGLDLPPLVHGVIFSLIANISAFIGFSLTRAASPIERLQANIFVQAKTGAMAQSFRSWRAQISITDLEMMVARYLGAERTQRAFDQFLRSRGSVPDATGKADIHLLRFAEHLLASAIGAASSRLALSLLFKNQAISHEAALRLVDETSAAIQHNRDLLQQAIDFARQGITVFDRDLRLICWNREFRDLFELPADMLRIGVGLDEIIQFNAARGLYGPGPADEQVALRLEMFVSSTEPVRLHIEPLKRVIEIRSARLPDDGLVAIFTDVTVQVESEKELAAANETLERRVRERTDELARAKTEADDANISKTRFLAAASHDILQPLNAARLYATSLKERMNGATSELLSDQELHLVRNVDASLEAVEEILIALLEISRIDAGSMKPERTSFRIDDILNQLRLEFEPVARERGIELVFVSCSLAVLSDRRLLRRLLQNLVSNAIKYTPKGRVLVGVRRRCKSLHVQVWDTGLGIPEDDQRTIFDEFKRLAPAVKTARGLGLGLSIVDRLSRMLGHHLSLRSKPHRGSVFAIEIPLAATVPQQRINNALQRLPIQQRQLTGLTVAVLDNEPQILEGMGSLLEGWGCTLVAGRDLDELIAAFKKKNLLPDVIIADYHLDGSNGMTAIDILRRHTPGLPAVLLTADRSMELRERCSAKDIRVLNKPLKPAALRALLSQWQILKFAVE
jgi:Na+/proline symporter/signal transduction histidine kinase